MLPAHDVYDHSLKLAWRHDPRAIVRLSGQPVSEVGDRVDCELVESLRRAADGARHVVGPVGPFVLHNEFISRADPGAPDVIFANNVLLRHSLPGHPVVRSVLFVLRPIGRAPPPELVIAYGDDQVHRFRFTVVELYALPAAELANDPLLAQFTPLGQGAMTQAVRVRIASDTIRAAAGEAMPERLGVLRLLARAEGLSEPEIETIIHWSEVRMAHSYEEIWQAAQQEGEEIGLERGFVKGIAQGVAQGVAQGFVEGERRVLLWQLSARFPDEAAQVQGFLASVRDDHLEWLAARVMTATNLAALQGALAARGHPPA